LNLGGLYAEELCTRAGVEKTLDIADATEREYRAIHDAIADLAAQLRAGDFDPRLYLDGDRVVDATPFPLRERERAELNEEAYDTFNEALDEYFYRLELDDDPVEEGTNRPDFEAEIAKQQRIIEQQEGAIEGFEEQAQAEREKAELLYANYDLVDEVLSTVRDARDEGVPWSEIESTLAAGADRGIPAAEAVVGVDSSAGTVTIDLDGTRVEVEVTDGVEKNADRLYTEAKRIEEKKEGALAAIEDTREELAAVRARKEAWEAEDDEDDDDEEQREVDWLSRSSIPVRRSDHWYERFRWFETSDGYLVVGGRNADQNEELVKKYLSKHDRFLHAQAHGGPVTLLKASRPSEPSTPVDFPDATLAEAAQFAVAYSSVWKDGRHAGDAYLVTPDQVSKTPESGEYLEKGGFVIRGDRTYFRDVEARVAVGVQCEGETRVIGGPPSAVDPRVVTSIHLEPGRYAQNDAAKMCYREFKTRFEDQSFLRKVASPDRIQEFLPPGGSELRDVDR
jgi:predicted ribosome quality control (RQC) complex YloA/Tae2 family protein